MIDIQTRSKSQLKSRLIPLISTSAAAFAFASAVSAESLVAKPDSAEATTAEMVKIDVLDNDSGVVDNTALEIMTFPANGVASVTSTNKIKYTSYEGFEGTDTLVYRIRNSSTNKAKATVNIAVTCPDCSTAGVSDGSLTLSWKPGEGNPTGYDVYYGPDRQSIDSKVTTVDTNSSAIDPSRPEVSFDPKNDLGGGTGDKVCFAIIAFNDFSESKLSDSVCTTL